MMFREIQDLIVLREILKDENNRQLLEALEKCIERAQLSSKNWTTSFR